jgi:subtilisin family serine protease
MNQYIVKMKASASSYDGKNLKQILPDNIKERARIFLNKHSCSKESHEYLDNLSSYYTFTSADELSEIQLNRLRSEHNTDSVYKYIAPEADNNSLTPIGPVKQKVEGSVKNIGEFQPENNPYFIEQRQVFANPFGIDALYSWSVPGGDGSQASIYVVDNGIDDVEDFEGTVNILASEEKLQHGTAVTGLMKMQDNNIAGIGISPKSTAYFHYVPKSTEEIVAVLLKALDFLEPGDVINFSYQREYLPVILEPLYFDAIKTLTEAGIVFVLIAGNDTKNLDEVTNSEGKYILNVNSPDYADSGAIIVSGCLPEFNLPRALNYGSIVDTMAFCEGALTVSTGDNGTLFGGTSAAAPIISGVVLNIQSALKAAGRPPLKPKEVRALLRDHNNGQSSSTIYPSEHVSLPSLRKIFTTLGLPAGSYDGNYAVDTNTLKAMQDKVDGLFLDKEHTVLVDTVNAGTINDVEEYLNNSPFCELKRSLLAEIQNAYKLIFKSAVELIPSSKLLDPENWEFSGQKSVTSGPDGLVLAYSDGSDHLGISYRDKLVFEKGKRYRFRLSYKVFKGGLGGAMLNFGAISIEDGSAINSDMAVTGMFKMTYRLNIDQEIFLDYIPEEDLVTTGVPAFYFSYISASITLRINSVSVISY